MALILTETIIPCRNPGCNV